MQNRDVQALLPLTVKQISDASVPGSEKSEFVVDGADVNNVSSGNLNLECCFNLFSFFLGENLDFDFYAGQACRYYT